MEEKKNNKERDVTILSEELKNVKFDLNRKTEELDIKEMELSQ